MDIRINNRDGFFTGLFYLAIGAAAAALASTYDVGSALNMGPGFFPAMIGLILCGLGLGLVVQSALTHSPAARQEPRVTPLLLLVVGMLSFAFLIERAGLFVAIFALLFFACFERLRHHPLEVLIITIALAGFSALLFVYAFGMVMPLLPPSLS